MAHEYKDASDQAKCDKLEKMIGKTRDRVSEVMSHHVKTAPHLSKKEVAKIADKEISLTGHTKKHNASKPVKRKKGGRAGKGDVHINIQTAPGAGGQGSQAMPAPMPRPAMPPIAAAPQAGAMGGMPGGIPQGMGMGAGAPMPGAAAGLPPQALAGRKKGGRAPEPLSGHVNNADEPWIETRKRGGKTGDTISEAMNVPTGLKTGGRAAGRELEDALKDSKPSKMKSSTSTKYNFGAGDGLGRLEKAAKYGARK